jgi:hypothetical protein
MHVTNSSYILNYDIDCEIFLMWLIIACEIKSF